MPIARHRRLDPTKVFVRTGLLLCGVALTWTCAAFGLLASEMIFSPRGCRLRVHLAPAQVRDIESAISQYQIDQNHCPQTKDDLLENQYIGRKSFEDPWGTAIAFTCTDAEIRVESAGPDRIFGTVDDVTNWR